LRPAAQFATVERATLGVLLEGLPHHMSHL